jgi:hypothetical protein
MTTTHHFCIYGRFHELLPTVWGFRGDLQGPWHSIHVWEAWQKIIIFAFMTVFVSYWPQFWDSGLIYKVMTLFICLRGVTKNSSFLHFRAVFMSYCPQFWVPGWFIGSMTLSTFLEGLQKTRHLCVLGPFSWAIAYSFGVLDWFTRSMTLGTCLRGMTKNSSFFSFMAVSVSSCPLFWGSMEI